MVKIKLVTHSDKSSRVHFCRRSNRTFARLFFLFLFLACQILASSVQVLQVKGNVQVRRGLDEQWGFVNAGVPLEELDSITTGAESQVTLQTREGQLFRLGPNAMIDIADLRRITEHEMFLFIMSQKIDNLDLPANNAKLEIGSVSVIHGDNKAASVSIGSTDVSFWLKELNGARALQQQLYFTNAVVKYHKLLRYDDDAQMCGAIHYELGHCFEQLQQTGQALDAYQSAKARLEKNGCQTNNVSERLAQIDAAISRLKEK